MIRGARAGDRGLPVVLVPRERKGSDLSSQGLVLGAMPTSLRDGELRGSRDAIPLGV